MADIFAKIADIPGESLDVKHKGEIEVLSWSWGITQGAAIASPGGGGAASGKPTFEDFHITHAVDKASPNLLRACATGRHISEVIVTERKAGPGQQEFLTIKLSDVLITGVHPSANAAGGSAGLVEGVTLQCAKVDLEYKPQKADGSLDAGIHFKYDIKANKEG